MALPAAFDEPMIRERGGPASDHRFREPKPVWKLGKLDGIVFEMSAVELEQQIPGRVGEQVPAERRLGAPSETSGWPGDDVRSPGRA